MLKDDFVIKEGDDGDDFYIIESGQVDCLKLYSIRNKTGLVRVRTLGQSEHFGELALLNNMKRSLSIRVRSEKIVLLRLDRDAFTRILGSIEKNLKKDYDSEFENKILSMRK